MGILLSAVLGVKRVRVDQRNERWTEGMRGEVGRNDGGNSQKLSSCPILEVVEGEKG